MLLPVGPGNGLRGGATCINDPLFQHDNIKLGNCFCDLILGAGRAQHGHGGSLVMRRIGVQTDPAVCAFEDRRKRVPWLGRRPANRLA